MLETPHGFLTYGFNCVPGADFSHVYLEDLYVTPEMRKTHLASTMADKVADIARERGIEKMLGSVSKHSKTKDAAHRVLIAYGMTPYAEDQDIRWYIKDIK